VVPADLMRSASGDEGERDRMTGDELRRDLAERGILAVLRASSARHAIVAGQALAEGSVTAIEVTFTVPDAPVAIARLAADDSLLVGAGTVLTPDQATAAVHAGARFLVSPHLDDRVLDVADELGVPALPGVLTPTEIAKATLRCSLVKLFPASMGGPELLAALRKPFPDLAVVPTGGVDSGNLGDWLAAGAIAVGAGADLCPRTAVEAGDAKALRGHAERYVAALAAARAPDRGPLE
jgi:2-dehydro-3-deoxyphosphogluconate aldolase / (4S)-4-hydroxy-2-oxoglutarate aldolase